VSVSARQPPAVIVPDGQTALGLVRSLAPQGVVCTVCAWNQLGPAAYSRHARVIRCPPPSSGRAFIDALIRIGRSFSTRPVLFTADETSTLLADYRREELSAHFDLGLASAPQLGELVYKPRLYQICADAGVPTPETWLLNGEPPPVGLSYPAVLKPAQRVIHRGNYQTRSFRFEFGAKAVLVRNAAEARTIATRAQQLGFEVLLQRLVAGPVTNLLTAGVFAGRKGGRALFTARKLAQVPHDFGDGAVVEGVPLPEVGPPALRLVEQSGLVGMADIEFKRDSADGQLKLLDVNPRPWLWIELATRCGVNLPHLLYEEAIASRDAATPVQTTDNITWCSTRSLLRIMRRAHGREGRVALGAAVRAWRRDPSGDDVGWRMAVRQGFWRDLLRAARGQLPEM